MAFGIALGALIRKHLTHRASSSYKVAPLSQVYSCFADQLYIQYAPCLEYVPTKLAHSIGALANLPVGNDQLHPGRVTSRDPDEGPIYRRVTGKEPGSSRKIGQGPRGPPRRWA